MGFIVLISTSTPGARYVGTFFAAIGTFPAIALSITWNANNISDSPTKRAVSVALQSSCGSFGGVIGSYAYDFRDFPLLLVWFPASPLCRTLHNLLAHASSMIG